MFKNLRDFAFVSPVSSSAVLLQSWGHNVNFNLECFHRNHFFYTFKCTTNEKRVKQTTIKPTILLKTRNSLIATSIHKLKEFTPTPTSFATFVSRAICIILQNEQKDTHITFYWPIKEAKFHSDARTHLRKGIHFFLLSVVLPVHDSNLCENTNAKEIK